MFTVRVADNFHYMDEEETYIHSEHATWADAVAEARRLVDASLAELYRPGMSGYDLYSLYTSFGDAPYIVPTPQGKHFSAWEYAKQRAEVECSAENGRDRQPPSR